MPTNETVPCSTLVTRRCAVLIRQLERVRCLCQHIELIWDTGVDRLLPGISKRLVNPVRRHV